MPGIPELLIILAIILVLFGGRGRIASLFGELGTGISSFRKGLKDGAEPDDNENTKKDEA
jgi:sec-independent protein translocase protein TatA